MQAILITMVSLVVGGALAGATVVGLVNSQTAAPDKSPIDSSNVTLDYGSSSN
ncbi:hypothetical protein ABLE68_21160 [Nocardioides sp. CN2-186]|uniref:hypothetical protein n=1 Tax=Nocardioides tweenelious TaxID=3156607 RepID=UPI0032B3E984